MRQEQSAARFFDSLGTAFQQATQALGATDYYLAIAESMIRLRFAGTALQPAILPALAHLVSDAVSEPELTICLWDTQSSKARLPALPWRALEFGAPSDVEGFNNADMLTIYREDLRALTLVSLQQATAFFVIAAPILPVYEMAAPLREVFQHWQAAKGRLMVHAAAVGVAAGGVMVVGNSGAGKSTSALACVGSDLLYAGDDYTLLQPAPDPFVYSLYNSAKVNKRNLAFPPIVTGAADTAQYHYKDKAVFFLQQEAPAVLSAGFPLRAILVPQATGQADTALTRISAAAGLMALAPSSVLRVWRGGQDELSRMALTAQQTPVYLLAAGTELQRIPVLISELLNNSSAVLAERH